MSPSDEHTVICPECGGDGGWDAISRYGSGGWTECRFCDGSGEVPTEPATDIDDFEAALIADGEKLRALTGEDRGPWTLDEIFAPAQPKGGKPDGE